MNESHLKNKIVAVLCQQQQQHTAASTMVHSATAAVRIPSITPSDWLWRTWTRGDRHSLTINSGVTLVAAADLRHENCQQLFKGVSKAHPDKVDAQVQSCTLDSTDINDLDDPDIDVVFLTTSPGFRPLMIGQQSKQESMCLLKSRSALMQLGITCKVHTF